MKDDVACITCATNLEMLFQILELFLHFVSPLDESFYARNGDPRLLLVNLNPTEEDQNDARKTYQVAGLDDTRV